MNGDDEGAERRIGSTPPADNLDTLMPNAPNGPVGISGTADSEVPAHHRPEVTHSDGEDVEVV